MNPAFGSFWKGELSPFEMFCLSSFSKKGYDVVLYSYERLSWLPDGVQNLDAREIVAESYMDRFKTDGLQNISQFSDYFRYNMFLKTTRFWIDADVILLRDFNESPDQPFLVAEGQANVCNAFLRIPSSSNELKKIILDTEKYLDKDIPWAAVQSLVADSYKLRNSSRKVTLRQSKDYMPVGYDDFYKVLLPEHLDECMALCTNAHSVHLYNNILGRIGYYKYLMPPTGSYLNEYIKNNSYDSMFCGTYPSEAVRNMVEGWKLRFNGKWVGTKALASQIMPSIHRSIRRRLYKV
jgi:hypothetical protein